MTRGVYARLTRQESQALLKLASSKRRDVRDQAAYLIRQSLEQLNLLPPALVVSKSGERASPPLNNSEENMNEFFNNHLANHKIQHFHSEADMLHSDVILKIYDSEVGTLGKDLIFALCQRIAFLEIDKCDSTPP